MHLDSFDAGCLPAADATAADPSVNLKMTQPLRHCRRPQCNYNSMPFVTVSAQTMFTLDGGARPHLHAGNHGVHRAFSLREPWQCRRPQIDIPRRASPQAAHDVGERQRRMRVQRRLRVRVGALKPSLDRKAHV